MKTLDDKQDHYLQYRRPLCMKVLCHHEIYKLVIQFKSQFYGKQVTNGLMLKLFLFLKNVNIHASAFYTHCRKSWGCCIVTVKVRKDKTCTDQFLRWGVTSAIKNLTVIIIVNFLQKENVWCVKSLKIRIIPHTRDICD